MKVKSENEVAQSCPTLSDPMDHSLPGSSVHGIFQARVLEWGAIAFFSYCPTYLQISVHFFQSIFLLSLDLKTFIFKFTNSSDIVNLLLNREVLIFTITFLSPRIFIKIPYCSIRFLIILLRFFIDLIISIILNIFNYFK